MTIIHSQGKGRVRAGTVAVLLILCSLVLSGQSEKKYVRQGNREYEKSKYADSEISYRKASDKNQSYPDAVFNTGDALYRQNKFEEAGKQFIESAKMNEDGDKKSASLYNLGNSFLKANKLEESIEAYKNSLKANPSNREAKYNLAYAQDLLKKQQQQQQQQQQDKDNKDRNKQDQKDKQDQKNKDQDKQKDDQQNKDDKQQQQQQPQQAMSKDDADRLLNALANDEKNVQEKVKLAKAAKDRVKTAKNW